MNLKAIVGAATAVVVLITTIGGAVAASMNHVDEAIQQVRQDMVPLAEFEQYVEQNTRRLLRELEKEIREYEGDPRWLEQLEEDYEELLEEYCLDYPEDKRRCDDGN